MAITKERTEEIVIGAVSYTHLDVYKRQPLNLASLEKRQRFNEFCHSPFLLDVYKRQGSMRILRVCSRSCSGTVY